MESRQEKKSQATIDAETHLEILSKSKWCKEKKYISELSFRETEHAIKDLKWAFQNELSAALNLERKTASLFVLSDTGVNDNLNGSERPVSFDLKFGANAQIVHSLAKWKRLTLHKHQFEKGSGIYTDMNAIRRDEDLSPLHSYYVDQWDWELVIGKEERTVETLKKVVMKIYDAIKKLEIFMHKASKLLLPVLPENIVFVTTQELEDAYPELSPKERETEICRKHKAVFLMQVGKILKSGSAHDGRAPDYDDWELNGDILFYYEPLDIALEISSMGIRVDSKSLQAQLKYLKKDDYMKYKYHQMVFNDELPFTIGGGIGQSRLCMFILKKLHVGEVQSSLWPAEVIDVCSTFGIELL